MKILCVFGKYSYGDPLREISPEYASFIPALERLGHDVVHFESWDRIQYSDFAELNKALIEIVEKETPDVMFAVQLHYEIWIETLQIIKAFENVITICWTTDDSWKYREVSRFIGRYYDFMTTTYPEVLPFYKKDGIDTVLLTQWAANSHMMIEPLPAAECSYPVSFIGAAHGNRKRKIEKLKRRGIQVFCFGYGWPEGPVSHEKINRIMNESIISLNFANSKGENQIKARTFEVPGAGGFLLTEYSPGLKHFYNIGRDIESFSGDRQLADKINFYLKNYDKRDTIACSGFKRTIQEHTYDIRMKEILESAIKFSRQKKGESFTRYHVSFDQALKKHRFSFFHILFKIFLVTFGVCIFGRKRGPRAARRFLYEISWRIFGEKTYKAAGLPGRLFPDQ